MQAIVLKSHGGPDVLEPAEVEDPQPGPGELVVDVTAVGVNFMDVYQRIGRPPYAGNLPKIPGAEGAGVVRAVGEDVGEFEVGARVAWTDAPGSYAEQVVVRAERAVSVPESIDLDTAAAVMLQGITAHYLCHSTFKPAPGDPVVAHAAAGGVGRLLVQLLKQLDALVVATTSNELKARLAASAGADRVVPYEDVPRTVTEVSGGIGAAAVYDGVGAATFETSISSLRPRGMMVLYGAASGPVPPFDLARLAELGSLFVTRPTLRHYIATRDELSWRSSEIFRAVENGELEVRIGATYRLDEAALAHDDLESRRTTGKLLLHPS